MRSKVVLTPFPINTSAILIIAISTAAPTDTPCQFRSNSSLVTMALLAHPSAASTALSSARYSGSALVAIRM
jgi:hypothetical protein